MICGLRNNIYLGLRGCIFQKDARKMLHRFWADRTPRVFELAKLGGVFVGRCQIDKRTQRMIHPSPFIFLPYSFFMFRKSKWAFHLLNVFTTFTQKPWKMISGNSVDSNNHAFYKIAFWKKEWGKKISENEYKFLSTFQKDAM